MPAGSARVSIIILNYNRTADTIACLDSLEAAGVLHPAVHVVDNGSRQDQVTPLAEYCAVRPAVRFHPNGENLGFAEANNRVLEAILAGDEADQVLLLNNDTLVTPGFLRAMQDVLDPANGIEMAAARMVKFSNPEQVDNLGLTLFKSGFSLLRMSTGLPMVGPCAGCGLYTVRLLRTLKKETGHLFDPLFFMYSEDFDLALRAVLLGFRSAYAPDARVLHKGASSTGGPLNDFVLYHNFRNSLFVIAKNFPAGTLVRLGGWMLLMQALVLFKYTVKWSLRPVLRAYFDFFRHLGTIRRHRRVIQRCRVISGRELGSCFARQFYDPHYIRKSLRALWRHDVRKSNLAFRRNQGEAKSLKEKS